MDKYMKRTEKVFWITAAAMGVAVFICRKTKQIQKRAKEEGRHVPFGPYEAVLKRPFDVLVVAAALLVLAPVMGITALLVRVKLGSPVIFKQERPGKDERIFTLYKFRTMTDERDENGELLPDTDRLPATGKMLRFLSLDELPELFQIIRGDMSIVGPRPLIPRYLPYYTEREKHRHDVRPGLTGLAQTSGRNTLSWDERLELDIQYTDRITFLGDLKIIWTTIKKVFRAEDIVVRGTGNSVPDFDVERRRKMAAGEKMGWRQV